MKKLILIFALVSMTGCSSLVSMNEKHSGEKKAMRIEHRQEIKEVKKANDKEMKKLKTKQSVEFTLYVAKKLDLLKQFFK